MIKKNLDLEDEKIELNRHSKLTPNQVTDDQLIAAARQAQISAIKHCLFKRHPGRMIIIRRWDDDCFKRSSFQVHNVKTSISLIHTGNRLRALVKKGILVKSKSSFGCTNIISYRFPRKYCDECAVIATREWLKKGYSLTELRPEKVSREKK